MDAPRGNVTFLFTDIEGSSRLWEREPEGMRAAVRIHDALLGEIFAARHGYVFKTLGDAFCVAFASPLEAVLAARDAQLALSRQEWPPSITIQARMAMLAADIEPTGADYFGPPLNRVARLLAIASGGQTLATAAIAELVQVREVEWRDMGMHRLRDLLKPLHVHQLLAPDLPDEFPALKSLSTVPNSLPEQLTPFIGRDAELEVVRRLLADHRLLTLQGPGGVGKTRLALQAAANASVAYGGVWLVDLSALRESGLIDGAIAEAMALRVPPNQAPIDAVVAALQGSPTLLLIDNCEQVIEGVARTVETILQRCRETHILATSREPLNVHGEQRFRVPSLGLPTEEDSETMIAASECVQLFVDRVRAIRPDFEVGESLSATADLCRRLDGIPLAIELAAARMRSMTITQVLERLNQRFQILTSGSRTAVPRQQTLRAAIEWSHDLLTESEATLFRRLGIFVGGWSLGSAESLLGSEFMLDELDSLIEKSLVAFDEDGRYRYSETVREFAVERVESAGEAPQLRLRHLEIFRSKASTWQDGLSGPNVATFGAEIDAERGNILVALQFAGEDPSTADLGLEICAAIGKHYMMRGRPDMVIPLVQRLLDIQGGLPTVARGDALVSLAMLLFTKGRPERGAVLLREAIAVYEQTGHDRKRVGAMGNLATMLLQAEDTVEAERQAYAVLDFSDQIGDPLMRAPMASLLGYICYMKGDYIQSERLSRQALEIFESDGNRHGAGVATSNLAHALRRQGKIPEAAEAYRASLNIRTALKDRQGTAWLLEGIAKLELLRGHPSVAIKLLASVADLREKLGIAVSRTDAPEIQAALDEARELAPDFQADWRAGVAMGLGPAVDLARSAIAESVELEPTPSS